MAPPPGGNTNRVVEMAAPSRRFAVGSIVSGALLALGLSGSPAVLAGGQHQVTVLGGGGGVVAVFSSAKCRKHRGEFKALTGKTGTGYTLSVSIEDFSGFHTYDLVQSPSADPWISVHHGPSGVSYSNIHKPPFPSPGFGQIRFSDHHKLMGIGYSPAYSQDGSDAVTFTGVLRCRYPRNKPHH